MKTAVFTEKLYERVLDYGREWFFSADDTVDAEEVFQSVFWSEASVNLDEKETADKFYAVFEAVSDQLEEDGIARSIDLWAVVSPSLDSETMVVYVHRPTGKMLYFLSVKSWHVWDSPEALKEDLKEIYTTAREKLEKRECIIAADGPTCAVYEVPASLAQKEEITKEELEEKGRFLFEMGEPVWIEIPVFEWENGKYVRFSD